MSSNNDMKPTDQLASLILTVIKGVAWLFILYIALFVFLLIISHKG